MRSALSRFLNHYSPAQAQGMRAAYLTAEFGGRTAAPVRVVNAASELRLYVYDIIGLIDWDTGESTAAQFVKEVHGFDGKTIHAHLNSPGGFVFDALSMFEALADHKADVQVHVDGLAASAASVLAMAGDRVEIAKGGRMMIHDAQGVGIGSPADLREYADILDAVSDDIAGYYADRAGGKPDEWRTAMTATTWYSADQAKDAGLVDAVKRPEKSKAEKEGPDARSRVLAARARITLGG